MKYLLRNLKLKLLGYSKVIDESGQKYFVRKSKYNRKIDCVVDDHGFSYIEA